MTDEKEVEKSAAPQEDPEKKVKIIINEAEGESAGDVLVGVNGVLFQLQRDTELEVPQKVVWALDNAVESRYTQVTHKDGSIEMQERKVKTYPYMLVQ